MNDHKTKATDEILTGYSKIIEALTEKGRWQAERIRELEAALAKSAEAQNHFCGRWLWQAMLAQQYKQDYLEIRHKLQQESVCHGDQCKLNEIERVEAENKRLRGWLEEAQEEIQNCYGRDIDLTERIWEALEGGSE